MKLIFDKYIIKELFGPFLFGMAAFTCILAGTTVLFPLIGEAVKHDISMLATLQLFLYKLPAIIVFTFPMSMLLATIMGIGRLSSDLEIIAFRASGIGIYRLVAPIVALGLLVSLSTILFNEVVVPKSSTSAEMLLMNLVQTNTPKIQENINMTQYDKQGLVQRIINVMKIENNKLKDITVAEYESGRLARVIRADSGKYISAGRWEFYDGILHSFDQKQKDKIMVIEFKKEYLDIQINPMDFGKREKSIEEMNAKELKKRIAFKLRTGQDPTSDQVQYYMKFAVPFASLIFCILGASIGLKPNRTSSAIGFGLSLLIIIIYYVLISLGMYLGLAHLMSPLVAAWIPNIVTGITGVYLLKKLTVM